MPRGDCRARLERLFDYLDGELDPRDCAALERHLASCECCGDLAASLRRTIDACRAAGHPRLPSAVQARARARVRALLRSTPSIGPRKRRTRASP
ncbi:MAG: zf-HC2 domain-containing protein [Acidobacteriota bacterium]